MFGLSFGELLIIGVVGIVVVGPRNLPTMLRTLGRLIGQARRTIMEVRADTGIDEVAELRALREEVTRFRRIAAGEIELMEAEVKAPSGPVAPYPHDVDRTREQPRIGCDSYGAISEDEAAYVPVGDDAAPPATPGAAPPAASPATGA